MWLPEINCIKYGDNVSGWHIVGAKGTYSNYFIIIIIIIVLQ